MQLRKQKVRRTSETVEKGSAGLARLQKRHLAWVQSALPQCLNRRKVLCAGHEKCLRIVSCIPI
jgi:hypothetical protein